MRVFATDPSAGTTDTAAASGVGVVNLSGSWAVRDPSGALLVNRGMSLSQGGPGLRGDFTYLAGCLVAISGEVTAPALTLSFALPPANGCRPFPVPVPSTFSGTADADAGAFTGTLSGVGPAVVSRCANNTTVANCE